MAEPGEKVVALRGQVMPTEPTVVPHVVERLEELLAMARAGEIVGIAYATVHPGDVTGYGRIGRQVRALLGALDLLKFDMCKGDE
jgi:hypothetical protein